MVGLLASVWGVAACGSSGIPGTIVCKNKIDVDAGGACTLSFSDCADGNDYSVECANDVCSCFSDKGPKQVAGLTDCPGSASEMNEDCGFDVKD